MDTRYASRKFVLACVAFLVGCTGNPIATANSSAVLLTLDDTTCSGTIVGPHAILTAEHCLEDSKPLAVDGRQVAVNKVLLDKHDHALVLVDQGFRQWATMGIEPSQGDTVFVLGNPGALRDMYRKATVSGYDVYHGKTITMYDMNGYPGDSGSGIFNADGQLVGVISLMNQQTGEGYMKMMASYSLAFTAQQWAQAL